MSTLLIIYVIGVIITWASYEAYMAYTKDFGAGLGLGPAVLWPIILGLIILTSPGWIGVWIGTYFRNRASK
jgi:hypothetical protein